MAIVINNTTIKKIFVEDTEIFRCIKNNYKNNDYSIWLKPFNFSAPGCSATIKCGTTNSMNKWEPSRSTNFLVNKSSDEVYAYTRLEMQESDTFTLNGSNSLTKLNGYTFSFFENNVNKGNKTHFIYNHRVAQIDPAITTSSRTVNRNYTFVKDIENSMIMNSGETLTLSDFDSIQVTSDWYTWIASDVSYLLIFHNTLRQTYTYTTTALFSCYEIEITTYQGTAGTSVLMKTTYKIEPIPMYIDSSISFYLGSRSPTYFNDIPYVQIIVTRVTESRYTVEVGSVDWPFAEQNPFDVKLKRIVT